MLRLTLRSGKDGRFLARVIDPGGFPFVLDFGDSRVIDDAHQKLLHGFTMWRFGELMTITPQDPNIVALLADYYVGEGALVEFEEPNWPGRESGSVEQGQPASVPSVEESWDAVSANGAPNHSSPSMSRDDAADDVPTQFLEFVDPFPADAFDIEDALTEEIRDDATEIIDGFGDAAAGDASDLEDQQTEIVEPDTLTPTAGSGRSERVGRPTPGGSKSRILRR